MSPSLHFLLIQNLSFRKPDIIPLLLNRLTILHLLLFVVFLPLLDLLLNIVISLLVEPINLFLEVSGQSSLEDLIIRGVNLFDPILIAPLVLLVTPINNLGDFRLSLVVVFVLECHVQSFGALTWP